MRQASLALLAGWKSQPGKGWPPTRTECCVGRGDTPLNPCAPTRVLARTMRGLNARPNPPWAKGSHRTEPTKRTQGTIQAIRGTALPEAHSAPQEVWMQTAMWLMAQKPTPRGSQGWQDPRGSAGVRARGMYGKRRQELGRPFRLRAALGLSRSGEPAACDGEHTSAGGRRRCRAVKSLFVCKCEKVKSPHRDLLTRPRCHSRALPSEGSCPSTVGPPMSLPTAGRRR